MYQECESWLRISTHRVVRSFLEALARSHGLQKLFLISPWISEFGAEGGMTFRQLLKRLIDDDATAVNYSNPEMQQRLKRELEAANIPHRTYERRGKEFIAWSREHDEAVQEIDKLVMQGPLPSGRNVWTGRSPPTGLGAPVDDGKVA